MSVKSSNKALIDWLEKSLASRFKYSSFNHDSKPKSSENKKSKFVNHHHAFIKNDDLQFFLNNCERRFGNKKQKKLYKSLNLTNSQPKIENISYPIKSLEKSSNAKPVKTTEYTTMFKDSRYTNLFYSPNLKISASKKQKSCKKSNFSFVNFKKEKIIKGKQNVQIKSLNCRKSFKSTMTADDIKRLQKQIDFTNISNKNNFNSTKKQRSALKSRTVGLYSPNLYCHTDQKDKLALKSSVEQLSLYNKTNNKVTETKSFALSQNNLSNISKKDSSSFSKLIYPLNDPAYQQNHKIGIKNMSLAELFNFQQKNCLNYQNIKTFNKRHPRQYFRLSAPLVDCSQHQFEEKKTNFHCDQISKTENIGKTKSFLSQIKPLIMQPTINNNCSTLTLPSTVKYLIYHQLSLIYSYLIHKLSNRLPTLVKACLASTITSFKIDQNQSRISKQNDIWTQKYFKMQAINQLLTHEPSTWQELIKLSIIDISQIN